MYIYIHTQIQFVSSFSVILVILEFYMESYIYENEDDKWFDKIVTFSLFTERERKKKREREKERERGKQRSARVRIIQRLKMKERTKRKEILRMFEVNEVCIICEKIIEYK